MSIGPRFLTPLLLLVVAVGCATSHAPPASPAVAAAPPPAAFAAAPPPTAGVTAAAAPPVVISPAHAANLAGNCFGCHGPQGASPGAIPSLARLSADDLLVKLQLFRSGELPSTVMGRHCKGYSEAELAAIAGHIAGLNAQGATP